MRNVPRGRKGPRRRVSEVLLQTQPCGVASLLLAPAPVPGPCAVARAALLRGKWPFSLELQDPFLKFGKAIAVFLTCKC